MTVSVDSHFWRTSVWPELHSLLFNVVEGKSVNWGVRGSSCLLKYRQTYDPAAKVSPWYTYPLVSLPRIMLLSYPFFLAGIIFNPVARRLVLPLGVYVAVMSMLQHKEWRFISYVIPTFNIVSLASIAKV